MQIPSAVIAFHFVHTLCCNRVLYATLHRLSKKNKQRRKRARERERDNNKHGDFAFNLFVDVNFLNVYVFI